MRRKDQSDRREQLARAARRVLLERGAVGVRVKDIADAAGLSPSSVLYYYPRIDDLLLEVSRKAIERYAESRAGAVAAVEGEVRRLRLAIHLGVPDGPDDEESRILYELDALTGSSPAFAVLTTSFYDRQVALYERVLAAGAREGTFELEAPPERIARGMIALEDGLGLQVVIGHPSLDSSAAERVLLEFATAMTGADLAAVPLLEERPLPA
ncbi:MAG: TetR family transcriptional regulator C-terminal domain-containing protein [Solirubrobacterales bacterium]